MDIQCIENITFTRARSRGGNMEDICLDLYRPVQRASVPRPALLLFHGGGFTTGNDKRQNYIVTIARHFAARGCVCASFDYRIREDPEADWPGTLADVLSDTRAALAWARANLSVYDADPFRMALVGGSAGGIAANNLVHHPARPVSAADGVLAVVNLWGSPPPEMRAFEQVNTLCPPNLIIHGTADELLPYAHSRDFCAELHRAGVPVALLTLEGAPHTAILELPALVLGSMEGFLRQNGVL